MAFRLFVNHILSSVLWPWLTKTYVDFRRTVSSWSYGWRFFVFFVCFYFIADCKCIASSNLLHSLWFMRAQRSVFIHMDNWAIGIIFSCRPWKIMKLQALQIFYCLQQLLGMPILAWPPACACFSVLSLEPSALTNAYVLVNTPLCGALHKCILLDLYLRIVTTYYHHCIANCELKENYLFWYGNNAVS